MRNNEASFYCVKLLIVMCISIMLSSCNGQVKTKSKIDSDPLEVSNSKTTESYNDPLFYIDGQLCQHLRKIYQDSKGHLWFGTNVYDLMHYNGDSLRYITKKDGFSSGRVTGIEEDAAGNIWIATGFGLNKFDGSSFTIFTQENGLANDEIWSLHIDSKGVLWVGHNEGLSRFDGKNFENIIVPKPKVEDPNTIFDANRIVSIVEDEEGNLWLGTDGFGICIYDGESFTHYTTDSGLCDNTIYELMIDSKGNLWIGTFFGGLAKYDGEKFMNFTNEGAVQGVEVGSLYEDNNGDVWFAAENNGVYKYDGNSFSHYYKDEGLNASILDIYRDSENRFWFGGWGGLFRYDGKSFISVTKEGPWKG